MTKRQPNDLAPEQAQPNGPAPVRERHQDGSEIERFLTEVQRPARYTGGEVNAVSKSAEGRLGICLVYPDAYDVGQPNLGLQILYELLNNFDDIVAERAYAPWPDMEAVLRRERIPLFSLETRRPLCSFDVVGFSLQYELTAANLLTVLDLGRIPLRGESRKEGDPLVIAGGPGAYNPEPLAAFIDLFVIGEVEEMMGAFVERLVRWKKRGESKSSLLRDVAGGPGIYVPSLYQVQYRKDGRIERFDAGPPAPERISRLVVKDLEAVKAPLRPVVPFIETAQDRAVVEIMRGCTRGCRFCQAGMIYRPVRERSPETVAVAARRILQGTGYEQVSLASLSSSDYTGIRDALAALGDEQAQRGVSISLPSLRVDRFSVGLVDGISRVKRAGLTFAAEAGTQRMRDVINKCASEDQILGAAATAFESGWQRLKLYFMLGLPTEKDEDVLGIARIVQKIADIGRSTLPRSLRGQLRLTVSCSAFVPKPHTPFQWVSQDGLEEIERKQRLLRANVEDRKVVLHWHDAKAAYVEGAIARGDRRVSAAIEKAYRMGSRFDAWTEWFTLERWERAFSASGLSLDFYTTRPRERDEILPWDFIDAGVSRNFLWREFERALRAQTTADCRKVPCTGCGICQGFGVENRLVEPARFGAPGVSDGATMGQ